MCDLEHADVEEISSAIVGAGAVVFAAGAGPGSGAERKLTMDRDGAIKLLEAARSAADRTLCDRQLGRRRDPPDDTSDRALAASDRAWTIVRPGSLTDDPGTGHHTNLPR